MRWNFQKSIRYHIDVNNFLILKFFQSIGFFVGLILLMVILKTLRNRHLNSVKPTIMLLSGVQVFLLHKMHDCDYSNWQVLCIWTVKSPGASGMVTVSEISPLQVFVLPFTEVLLKLLKYVHCNTLLCVTQRSAIGYTCCIGVYSYLFKTLLCPLIFFLELRILAHGLIAYLLSICIIFFVVLGYSLRLVLHLK